MSGAKKKPAEGFLEGYKNIDILSPTVLLESEG